MNLFRLHGKYRFKGNRIPCHATRATCYQRYAMGIKHEQNDTRESWARLTVPAILATWLAAEASTEGFLSQLNYLY